MFRLRIGYLVTGILTGLLLLLSFFATIPDGKLHITVCNVGQGDGVYIRFPNGKDMLIDGGPNTSIINCLSRHMPFWDRTIDMVLLTHPQKDHMSGLETVFERYHVEYFLRSDIGNTTEGLNTLRKRMHEKNIQEKLVTTGETISVGQVGITIVWPTKDQVIAMAPSPYVLGASVPDANVNDGSVVSLLSYGTFDALFMGDADSHVQPRLLGAQGLHPLARSGELEFFKVPHHGSKTGLTDTLIQKISPAMAGLNNQKPLAVISVGKNSYGHPGSEILTKLGQAGFQVLRTDQVGDIGVVSDGRTWDRE